MSIDVDMTEKNDKFLKDIVKMNKLFKTSFQKLAKDMANAFRVSLYVEPERPPEYTVIDLIIKEEPIGANLARRMIEESRETDNGCLLRT